MMTANYSRKWMMAGLLAFSAFTSPVMAQHNGLVDMSHSKEARMVNMPLGSTRWTGGFWGGRFKVFFRNLALGYVENLGYTRGIARLP